MKAVDANLLELLKKGTQFVVPIYQRVYSWEASECERLWDDILQAGRNDTIGAFHRLDRVRGEGAEQSHGG